MAEEQKFTIGGFTFENFYEYRNAQEDVRKIECINNELDVQDPEVAIRLYNDIRSGKIRFYSPIGRQFADHIGDIVANTSVDLLDDREVIEEANAQVKNQRILGLCLIAAAFVVFGYFGYTQIAEIRNTRQLAQMQSSVAQSVQPGTVEMNPNVYDTTVTVTVDDSSSIDPFHTEYIDPATLTILPQYEQLYNQNNDFIGWINIVDTDINYPVMQRKENDNFYLDHNFNGKSDSNGTLFADYRADLVNETVNTIIYGHNMKSGHMFGSLKNFLDKEYFESHRIIQFNTLYEERTYEIIAVGLSQVGTADDGEYKYYNFIDTSNIEDFNAFITNIHSMSVHEYDFNVSNTDKLLTLSTCNSYTDDGRLFIVAKKVNY